MRRVTLEAEDENVGELLCVLWIAFSDGDRTAGKPARYAEVHLSRILERIYARCAGVAT